MKKILLKYKATSIFAIISFFVMVLTLGGYIEVFENIIGIFELLEGYELDELFLVVFLLSIGLTFDFRKIIAIRKTKIEIQNQEMKVLKATMNNVLDIVNNFLNQTQLLRIEAEEQGSFSKESLKIFEDIIFETAEKLKQISELDEIVIDKTMSGLPLLAVNKNKGSE